MKAGPSGEEFLRQAYVARHAGDDEGAERLLREGLARNPRHAEILRELGIQVYGLKSDWGEARRLIEASLKIEGHAMGHLYLALVLDKQEEAQGACGEFEAALRTPKGDPLLIHSMYGDFLASRERYKEAERQFLAALALEPDYEPAREGYRRLKEAMADGED